MAVNCEIKQGVGVVSVTGSLNAAMAESFKSQFSNWFQNQPQLKQVVVDLGGVSFLDSSGLGVVVKSSGLANEAGGQLRVAGAQERVRELFRLTELDTLLFLDDSPEESARALKGR